MNLVGALVRRLGGRAWFDRLGRLVVPLDTAIHRRTGARFGLTSAAGIDTLLLTTIGRRSAEPRTVALLYVPVSGGYVVAASNFGGQRHPGWSANLLAKPAATVTVAGRTESVHAELVEGTERDRLWRSLTSAWPGYDSYADRASNRTIRVFRLVRDE